MHRCKLTALRYNEWSLLATLKWILLSLASHSVSVRIAGLIGLLSQTQSGVQAMSFGIVPATGCPHSSRASHDPERCALRIAPWRGFPRRTGVLRANTLCAHSRGYASTPRLRCKRRSRSRSRPVRLVLRQGSWPHSPKPLSFGAAACGLNPCACILALRRAFAIRIHTQSISKATQLAPSEKHATH